MKISVLMVTYNHEKFIAQAIDSVLMQEVNFDYEIVIGEDCSTDKTREIVKEYKRKHPDKIRLLLREKNLGALMNFDNALQTCKGEYVALLEGDDYWICPNKLQKQVDFLDSHLECTMCFHDCIVVYEDKNKKSWIRSPNIQKEIYTLKDVIKGYFIYTPTMMFRRDLIRQLPKWYFRYPVRDVALRILCAFHGKVGYIKGGMSAYRVHGKGFWSSMPQINQLLMQLETEKNLKEDLKENINSNYGNLLDESISSLYYEIASYCLKNGQNLNAFMSGGPARTELLLGGIAHMAEQIDEFRSKIKNQDLAIIAKDQHINNLNRAIVAKDQHIANLERLIRDKDAEHYQNLMNLTKEIVKIKKYSVFYNLLLRFRRELLKFFCKVPRQCS